MLKLISRTSDSNWSISTMQNSFHSFDDTDASTRKKSVDDVLSSTRASIEAVAKVEFRLHPTGWLRYLPSRSGWWRVGFVAIRLLAFTAFLVGVVYPLQNQWAGVTPENRADNSAIGYIAFVLAGTFVLTDRIFVFSKNWGRLRKVEQKLTQLLSKFDNERDEKFGPIQEDEYSKEDFKTALTLDASYDVLLNKIKEDDLNEWWKDLVEGFGELAKEIKTHRTAAEEAADTHRGELDKSAEAARRGWLSVKTQNQDKFDTVIVRIRSADQESGDVVRQENIESSGGKAIVPGLSPGNYIVTVEAKQTKDYKLSTEMRSEVATIPAGSGVEIDFNDLLQNEKEG